MTDTTLGQRIAERRRLLRMSQEALGELLEVSRQTVSKWEADAAIPETGKMVGMSQVFNVSVGWLLGIEELPQDEDPGEKLPATLTEEQLEQVEELIRQCGQTEPKGRRLSTRIAALCAAISLLAAIFTYTQTRDKLANYANELDSLSRSYTAVQQQLAEVTQKLNEQSESQGAPQLLSSYSLTATANKDGTGGLVTFEGFPHKTEPTDQVWLTVRLDGQEVANQLCTHSGSAYTAAIALPAADGYSYQYLVVHQGGGTELQLLDAADSGAVDLAQGLLPQISASFDWEQNANKLRFKACHLVMNPPTLLPEGESGGWTDGELIFYLNGQELQRVSLQKYIRYLTDESNADQGLSGTVYPEIEEISMESGDLLEARICGKMADGATVETAVHRWSRDSSGDITDVFSGRS